MDMKIQTYIKKIEDKIELTKHEYNIACKNKVNIEKLASIHGRIIGMQTTLNSFKKEFL